MSQGTTGSRRSRGIHQARIVAVLMLALGAVSLIAPMPAHAYIDPGSGALIWQGLVAAGVGALFYVRRFFQALRGKRGESNLSEETREGSSEKPR